MQYDEFITHVQSLAQSNSREDAERATCATLETIKERISSAESQALAAQLPQELAAYLQGTETKPDQDFDLQAFIVRVSQKENTEPITTAIHVRAVFAVLQNAIKPEEFAKLHAHFSRDYEEMFGTSPINEVPA
ncbi:DUF2267 domain-containing protein [Nostoc sp. TCL26-01]|uniref:DUF2267 domain-containing protein n=1 Tax=Nostoc sp. TCL26-01 TaxID=2576904 RepID=UPI0015BAF645|nr:DUF2267 domain-containing protein [Nostoc sp. TCL26-01]QLE59113.1 DUF2267 domain-containing protein [Nostoc sp. TCL26-01]